MPAHFCGIAGLKPTAARVPRTGHIIPFGLGAIDWLTQNGPMARYVEDLALTLPIIAGVDSWDPAIVPMPLGDPRAVDLKSLRVAVYTDNGIMTPTPETADVVNRAAAALEDIGSHVQEDLPEAIPGSDGLLSRMLRADGGAFVRRLLEKAGTTELHHWTQKRLDNARPMDVADFTALLEEVDRFRSAMHTFIQDYDVILCPVTAFPAQPHGFTSDENTGKGFSYAHVYSITGWPGAVMRGGTSSEGLPIGVQVVARPWREDVALAVAQHLETMMDGWQRPLL